ncbi:MAG: 16S rRNA (cytosine(967)-C(5))-methyltransferase RsmB [Candidatus Desulfofervidaceae bacterium]|nr:16S rRNA (cytosine(967)-C(5))-methyltransferase RsmB [Candidatus Desulfofervidaceae bacterium]
MAFKLIHAWEKGKGYPEALLQGTFAQYSSLTRQDKAFITELFYGTLRWLNQLDYIIDTFSQVKPQKIRPEVRSLLRLGVYQIYHLDRVPPAAAVYETVEIAKRLRLPAWIIKFINAILRTVSREREKISFPQDDPVCYIALKYAHPEWLVKCWLDEFGEEDTKAICEFNNTPPPVVIRTNTLKISRSALKKQLIEAGVEVYETTLSPEGLIVKKLPCALHDLPGFKTGLFLLQAEISQVISHLVAPKPGEFVLDGCAGVGGKTTHLAQLMQNRGQIFAVEPNSQRQKRLSAHLRRLDVHIVQIKPGHLQEVVSDFPHSYFDRILIDAPCSGLGVLRQHVDLKWKRKPVDIANLASIQIELLEAAAPYVKKDGVLVYVTCTLTREENQEIIRKFLQSFPQYKLESIAHLFPQYSLFCTKDGFFQTLSHKHGREGFFAARLRRL